MTKITTLSAPYGGFGNDALRKELRTRKILTGPACAVIRKADCVEALEADDRGRAAAWRNEYLRKVNHLDLQKDTSGEAEAPPVPEAQNETFEAPEPLPNGNVGSVFDTMLNAAVQSVVGKLVPLAVEKAVADLKIDQPIVHTWNDVPAISLNGHMPKAVAAMAKKRMKWGSEAGLNIFLKGPAGSGKTTAAKLFCQAIYGEDWETHWGFISLSAGVAEHHILGRLQPTKAGDWVEVVARFCEIYEKGGVFLLDEVGNADPNVMVAINAALANGQLANPITGKIHKRHVECIIVAADNTWLRGGDRMYTRERQDGAFINRFTMNKIVVDYDLELEWRIMKAYGLSDSDASKLHRQVKYVRSVIDDQHVQQICGTRDLATMAKYLKNSSFDEIWEDYFIDWSTDQREKVKLPA